MQWDAVTQINALLDGEKCMQAYALARDTFPSWEATDHPDTLLALGKLANACGDSSLSRRLKQKACKLGEAMPWFRHQKAGLLLQHHGPYETLRWLSLQPPALPSEVLDDHACNMLGLRCRLLTSFRDFNNAEIELRKALAHQPNNGSLWWEKCNLLKAQDRYDEALEASVEMLRLSPLHRWSVRMRWDLLLLHNRHDEALQILREASEQTESGYIACDQATLLIDLGQNEAALSALELARARLPLADTSDLRWLAGRRCDALHRLERTPEALEAAQVAARHQSGYYKLMAERFADDSRPRQRVQLPVGFVRQHHMTCGPATIAAVAAYWRRPIDHEQLARDICYDGTPDHAERQWLVDHGWLVREFTVDWETATSLIDRGCPILIVTVDIGSAHLQALIGYDRKAGTFLVRDPYEQTFSEWNAEGILKEQAINGPRGLVMLPPEEAYRLDGAVFPEAELRDEWFKFRRAIFLHREDDARCALAALRRLSPEHPQTLRAIRTLAHYEGNPSAALAPLETLRRLYPEDVNVQLEHIELLEQLGRVHESRQTLELTGASLKNYFVLQRRRASMLLADARQAARAGRILRRILRYAPCNADHLKAYADYLWEHGDRTEATRTYRLAATYADKNENLWRSYFLAEVHQGDTESCLQVLRERFELLGAQSNQTACTLSDALDDLDRDAEALAVLQRARELRPHDGPLALRLASRHARKNQIGEANRLLEEAKPHASRQGWLYTAARVATLEHDHQKALALWEEIVALDPTDIPAQRSCLNLVQICRGQTEVLARLATLVAAYPQHEGLRQLWLEYLRKEPASVALDAAQSLLKEHPADAWLLREHALILRRLGRGEEALKSAALAREIAPRSSYSHGVISSCLNDLQRHEEAREAALAGIRLDIDSSHIFRDLLDACQTYEQRCEAARIVGRELHRQISFNSASNDYLDTFKSVLPADEMTSILRENHRRHPAQWHAASALSLHLGRNNREQEALDIALENALRFPLLPRVWYDVASLHAQAGRIAEEAEALEQALRINPAWSTAARQLAGAKEKLRQPAESERILRRAIELDPLDGNNHAWLADSLWRQGRFQDAIDSMHSAIRCNHFVDWYWDALQDWSLRVHQQSAAIPLAETLSSQHAGETGLLLRLVRLRFKTGDLKKNLETLDQATRLDPLDCDIHDLRAQLLCEHLHFQEALAACQPAVYGEKVPHYLRGRAAWIYHQGGRPKLAIDAMRPVVEQHPDYVWGLGRITEWLADTNANEALKWAKVWAHAAPNDVEPLAWISDFMQRDGKYAESRAALEKALHLRPDYLYAAQTLLNLHLKANDLKAAESMAEHIRSHFNRAEQLRAEALIACKRYDWKHIAKLLAEMAVLTETNAGQLLVVCDRLIDAGMASLAAGTIGRLLANDKAHTSLPELWVKCRAKSSMATTVAAFHRLKVSPRHQTSLFVQYIEFLGQRKSAFGLFLLHKTRSSELRKSTQIWGSVGYAYSEMRRARKTVRWLGDWRERDDVNLNILNNLVLNQLRLNRHDEAYQVLQHAITLPPTDSSPRIAGWLAMEHALRGHHEIALSVLDAHTPPDTHEYAHCLHKIARTLIEFQQLPPDERKRQLDLTLESFKLVEIDYSGCTSTNAVRHQLKRARLHCARLAGNRWKTFTTYLMRPVKPITDTDNTAARRVGYGVAAVIIFKILAAALSGS